MQRIRVGKISKENANVFVVIAWREDHASFSLCFSFSLSLSLSLFLTLTTKIVYFPGPLQGGLWTFNPTTHCRTRSSVALYLVEFRYLRNIYIYIASIAALLLVVSPQDLLISTNFCINKLSSTFHALGNK
jgi:hypothetical protein